MTRVLSQPVHWTVEGGAVCARSSGGGGAERKGRNGAGRKARRSVHGHRVGLKVKEDRCRVGARAVASAKCKHSHGSPAGRACHLHGGGGGRRLGGWGALPQLLLHSVCVLLAALLACTVMGGASRLGVSVSASGTTLHPVHAPTSARVTGLEASVVPLLRLKPVCVCRAGRGAGATAATARRHPRPRTSLAATPPLSPSHTHDGVQALCRAEAEQEEEEGNERQAARWRSRLRRRRSHHAGSRGAGVQDEAEGVWGGGRGTEGGETRRCSGCWRKKRGVRAFRAHLGLPRWDCPPPP